MRWRKFIELGLTVIRFDGETVDGETVFGWSEIPKTVQRSDLMTVS